MLDSLPVLLIVGTVLGFLSGLGIGGGSLLILWLTFALGMDQATARTINLLFFIPSALAAILLRCRQGKLNLSVIFPAAAAGCAAAAVCSWLSGRIDLAVLRKLFGGLLIAAGLRELFYKRKK